MLANAIAAIGKKGREEVEEGASKAYVVTLTGVEEVKGN